MNNSSLISQIERLEGRDIERHRPSSADSESGGRGLSKEEDKKEINESEFNKVREENKALVRQLEGVRAKVSSFFSVFFYLLLLMMIVVAVIVIVVLLFFFLLYCFIAVCFNYFIV